MSLIRPIGLSRCAGLSGIRRITMSSVRYAREAEIGNERIKDPTSDKPKSRQQKIDAVNMDMQSRIYKVDNEFNIFHKEVRKVLDLGYVPGNWMSYSRFRLCQVHGIKEEEFAAKCHILGFDLLFGTPPQGVSTIQGNIFSKMANENIMNHFKEVALRELDERDQKKEVESDFQTSYLYKEQKESELDQEINDLAKNLGNLSLFEVPDDVVKKGRDRRAELLRDIEYRPDLILSDLSKPHMQQDGFFNQTFTRPYIRSAMNDSLNRPSVDPFKSSIDMADATLYTSASTLKPGGTAVIRLAKVDHSDPELILLDSRLQKVFNSVTRWSTHGSGDTIKDWELFFICKDKKQDNEFDRKQIFNL